MNIKEMKERKRELGYTNRQISDMSGVPYDTVQKIFGGITKSPRRKTLMAIEKVLVSGTGDKYKLPLGEKPTGMDYENSASYNPDMNYMDYRPYTAYQLREALATYGTGALKDEDGMSDELSEIPGNLIEGGKKQGEYTIDDYYALPDNARAELIDGVLYAMASPSFSHQLILGQVYLILSNFVIDNNGKCIVLPAAFDTQLDEDNDTMLQPDILIMCDEKRIRKSKYFGAPDMVIEILSPSTRRYDMLVKLRKYSAAGVREYWMIDYEKNAVIVYGNLPDDLIPAIYSFDDKVPVGIWGNKCKVDFRPIKQQLEKLL